MYAKIFSQIFDSSIAEDWQVRHVFEDFLKLADIEGIVDMTAEAIARRTNTPLEIVQHGIEKLCAPDPSSRSKKENGARLVLLDKKRGWCWQIVNYAKYRKTTDDETRREQNKLRQRRCRHTKAAQGSINTILKPLSQPCHADSPMKNVTHGHARSRQEEGEGEEDTEQQQQPEKQRSIKKKTSTPADTTSRYSSLDRLIPAVLDDPRFLEAWAAWKKHRTEKRCSLTVSCASSQLKHCAEMGIERAIAAVNFSTMQGYTGIFEPKAAATASSNGAENWNPDEAADILCDQIKSQKRKVI